MALALRRTVVVVHDVLEDRVSHGRLVSRRYAGIGRLIDVLGCWQAYPARAPSGAVSEIQPRVLKVTPRR